MVAIAAQADYQDTAKRLLCIIIQGGHEFGTAKCVYALVRMCLTGSIV